MTPYSESLFEKKRLDALLRQSSVALPGNLLVAACVTLLVNRNFSSSILNIWLAAMAIALLARFLISVKYRYSDKASLRPKLWFALYGISLFAIGSLWGALGAYVSLYLSMVYLSITFLILIGLVAASVSTNAVSKPAFCCFAFPMFMPAAVILMMTGDFEQIILGVLASVFLVVATLSVFQINRLIRESLIQQFEKTQLLESLEKEQLHVTELNKLLAKDIERRKQTENEKELLILELQDALGKVRTLSGLIPICANCKKIRDDKGYWNQIDSYIQEHADVDFSHGICPDCAKELYPDLDLSDV
jgi:hypothetical protein